MSYKRKTKDIYQLWSNYGYGWEIELVEETRKEAMEQMKCYKENTNGIFKIKKAREKI